MDQKVVTTTPTTSAWAAITSIVLAAVSNMRQAADGDYCATTQFSIENT